MKYKNNPKKGLSSIGIVLITLALTAISAKSALPPPPDGPPAPILTGIVLSGPAIVDEETTAQYVCTGKYSDGTTAPISASWSENSAYASISASGLLSAGNVSLDQNVTISAAYGGYSATLDVSIKYVAPVLTGITVSGPTVVNEETTAQYACTANYSDGTSASVTPVWSENSSYATISTSGLLSAGNITSDQTATITASFGGMSDTHLVSIKYVSPLLTNIMISGSTVVNEETTAQYACTANYSDGTTASVSPIWSENSSFASIGSSGLLSAGNVTSDQSVTVTASFGGKSDTHLVSIVYVAPTLTGIVINGPPSVEEEGSAQYTCTASYSDGTTGLVVPNWSQNSGYASISTSGLLVTYNVTVDQNFTITATYGGKTDTQAVTLLYVAPPVTLTGIAISGLDSVEENTTAQFTCTATYSDGSSATVTPAWNENSAFASINTEGLLSAGNIVADQSLTITATFEGETATQPLAILVSGTQVIYPLSGFGTIRAELWDDTAQAWRSLGEAVDPSELVVEDMVPGQWYWLSISEYDASADIWVKVQENWISM